jgi:uncharacterized protein YdeI (YjbR/CyaY-like superfamily)
MPHESPEVDAYIDHAADFARPILRKIRALFHKACPQIQETIKWGFPHFEHMGIVGNMAAFKRHVNFGFWKAKMLSDPHKLFQDVGNTSMGAARITDVSELPSDKILLATIREAVALNEKGIKAPAAPKKPRKELTIPEYFLAALGKNKKAQATFEGMAYSHKKEYVEWITEAKQEATRAKRLATALEWLAEGKPRNWKYLNC